MKLPTQCNKCAIRLTEESEIQETSDYGTVCGSCFKYLDEHVNNELTEDSDKYSVGIKKADKNCVPVDIVLGDCTDNDTNKDDSSIGRHMAIESGESDGKAVSVPENGVRTEFGEAIRDEFLLHEGSTFLNHGSYGAVPRRVHEYKSKLQLQMERHPQKWFDDSPRMLQRAIDRVSSFLGVNPIDTFLVQNVTKGCNTVIKNFPLKPGDAMLINSLTYPAVANTAHHTAATREAIVLTVDISPPIASEEEIIDKYTEILQQNPQIKLAIIDHITSSTALLMPVKRLTEVCHHYDVIVLVDGAHAPGQLSVSIVDVDADFYTGNFHKWVFTPRSCAVLWQNPVRQHSWFRPLVTSCEHGTTLQEEFGYEGIKDDSAYYSVTEGIAFIETMGGLAKIQQYNMGLLQEAFNYLSNTWGTSSISVPVSMFAPFMRLLQLPDLKEFEKTTESAGKLQQFILVNYNTDCKIYCRNNELFYRLSVQIYNNMNDFLKFGTVIKDLMA